MQLKVREATIEDCKYIYEWRTHPLNCEYSWSTDIKFKDHVEWFTKYLEERNDLMLIVEIDNKPCCVLRFDGELDHREVSIYMVPGYHNKGLGLPCLLLGELYLREQLMGLTCNLTAQIQNDNKASVKLFTRAGYIYSMADWYKVL